MNDHILIDAYLKGILTGDELESFKNRLESDAAFSEAVELQRIANQVIIRQERKRIKEQLNKIHSSKGSENSSGFNQWWILGFIILTLIILFVYNYEDTALEEPRPSLIQRDNSVTAEDTLTNIKSLFHIEKKEIVAEPAAKVKQEELGKQPNKSTKKNEPIDLDNAEVEVAVQLENQKAEKDNDIEKLIEKLEHTQPVVENNCDKVASVIPTFDLVKPCFGEEEGTFSLANKGVEDISFSEYSLDGGKNFHSSLETAYVKVGRYTVIARTDEGCISKLREWSIGYGDCNFAIQPERLKFFELEIPMDTEQETTIEIRSARSGVLVFAQELSPSVRFIWNGTDLAQNQLPLGNYVYWIKSKSKGVIAQGQIAIIR